MKNYDAEEDFHSRDRKQHRKERKIAQSSDRSKFKKTDSQKVQKKEETAHHLPRGRIIAITGEGCLVDYDREKYLCTLKGNLKKEKGLYKNLVAVGDWVRFDPQEKQIVQIEERVSFLARTDISGMKEQLIAVNIDQAIISISVGNPPLKPSLVDRYLIAAERGNIHPIIVINKMDLIDTSEKTASLYQEFISAYEPLGIPILSVSCKTESGIEALRSLLKNKTSVFFGQSGVGKSSLLNACFSLTLKTGELAQKTHKGSHTTTTAELIPLDEGGYCVDTPGIRSFAIWNVKKQEIIHHFKEILDLSQNCRFPDCSHLEEPDCAVIAALEEETLSDLRYNSFQALMSDCLGGPDQRTKRKFEE